MTQALATLNAQNITMTNAGTTSYSAGDYWPYYYQPTYIQPFYTWPQVWPTTIYYHPCVTEDRGKKAFELAQKLVEKKLVEARTAKQFIELMNTILETL